MTFVVCATLELIGFLFEVVNILINTENHKYFNFYRRNKGNLSEDMIWVIFIHHYLLLSNEKSAQANEVAKQINLWAEDASKGLITDLLQPDKLSPLTTIVLANGLYFKGIWAHKHKFDASLTKKRNFHLLTGDTISVLFMKSCERYHYRSFDTFKVLKIPYQSANPDRKFSMYFFLPHENVGLEHLFEELYSDSVFLKQDFFNLSMKSFDEVLIPKFKFSYEFDVSRTMEEMGMTFLSLKIQKTFRGLWKCLRGSNS